MDIDKVKSFQRELRKADAQKTPNQPSAQGNNQIDTPNEAEKALTYILTNLEIDNAPPIYRRILRKYVDSKGNANDKIDENEVAQAKKVLLKGRTRTEILENFVYDTPDLSERELKCKISEAVLPASALSPSRPGRYQQAVKKLAGFFLTNNGNPPNAVKIFKVDNKEAIGAYHVFEDEKTHLGKSGAATSESQTLFFNFMVLYAALTKDKRGMQGAYNYIKHFMMPHDGETSIQMPDQSLRVSQKEYMPYLMHWLIDVSGKTKSGAVFFGENIPFEIYESDKNPKVRIAQTNNDLDIEIKLKTIPSIHKTIPGTSDTYKFGAALDADQWLQNGLFWAKLFKLADFTPDIKCFRESLARTLSTGIDTYPQVAQFAYYWGGNVISQIGWGGVTPDIYAGYQDPAAWVIMGKPDIAKRIVAFLNAAQVEFNRQNKSLGPFMPVFNKGKFGWSGVDPNTDWMGFQYRTFAHLAHYYFLTGDRKAKLICDNFVNWVKSHTTDNNGKISIPIWFEKGSGKIRLTGYSPNHHGLFSQGLVFLAARSGDRKYSNDAQKLLDDAVKSRQHKNGSFPDPEPVDGYNFRYAFRQAELGIALSLYELLLK